jgi:hypothetical protein
MAEQSHSFYLWHQDVKIQRQLKMDNLREGTKGDSLSLIKIHGKTFEKRKKIILILIYI